MSGAARALIEAGQLAALRRLLAALIPDNRYYAPRLAAAGLDRGVDSLASFRARMPFTTKDELVADQARHPPFGSGLTYPLARYVRFHQTSGTSGAPLCWLDTEESWSWMLDTWVQVFAAAGIEAQDRVFFPFSFGPFLGFWTAFDAALRRGCLALPGGGLDSRGRLRVIFDSGATAICATPTYAIRLAEVAAQEGFDLGASQVRRIVVAGEPGGSVEATRMRIERAWPGAQVFDHHGMTEVGPVTVPNPDHPGVLHVRESAYLAEVIDPEDGTPVAPGSVGELVLTTLGRLGSPLLRYRTGDLVRRSAATPAGLGRAEVAFEGGILARRDDMVVVRGVNLYPSAVEAVVRAEPAVAEYRVTLDTGAVLSEVRVEIEAAPTHDDPPALCRQLEASLRTAFRLRIPVSSVAAGSLPRFEMKAKRWLPAAS